ncbi:hypothetical protein Syun_012678 [Stephania yunnanensis]|uniref:Uncharacterized protein n=1 Tax=Stephania yunnanensis TaxID=152371 RepID=A0AAP0JZU9_9MAGN
MVCHADMDMDDREAMRRYNVMTTVRGHKSGMDESHVTIRRQASSSAPHLRLFEKAKMDLSSLTQTNISLPFITATADGPKHIETTITRAKFEELCSDLLDRLTLAMAGIVINLHLPIPIVLSCGLKIGLADNYFAQFRFMAGVSQILTETNYQIAMAVAYKTAKVMQDAFLLVTAVKKRIGGAEPEHRRRRITEASSVGGGARPEQRRRRIAKASSIGGTGGCGVGETRGRRAVLVASGGRNVGAAAKSDGTRGGGKDGRGKPCGGRRRTTISCRGGARLGCRWRALQRKDRVGESRSTSTMTVDDDGGGEACAAWGIVRRRRFMNLGLRRKGSRRMVCWFYPFRLATNIDT